MSNQNRMKTYELLKTSWTYQTQEYFDNSTLHGVRYINEEGRPFCEKFMWFCFTSVGGCVTLIIIVSLWEKFQTNPTITGLDTDFHNWDVPFPTVSLCPTDPVDESTVNEYVTKTWPQLTLDKQIIYREFIKQVARISYFTLKNFNDFVSEKQKTIDLTTNFTDIVQKITLKCEDLFSKCTFKGEDKECCKILMPLMTEVGYCFSFNSMFTERPKSGSEEAKFELQYIHETDHKWSLTMDIENGEADSENNTINPIKVHLHSAQDFPVVDVAPQHVWDQKIQKIAFGSKQTYTTEGARQLTIKQRRCVFEDEIKLLTSDDYTYRSCMIQCRMKLAKELCNCVPFFYRKLAGFNYCDLKGLQCLGNNQGKLKHFHCPCELGCSNTVYEVEKLVGDIEQKTTKNLEVAFISWPMVRYKREVLFGWVDLLVSFGGIAGLFLGFSLLSGVEVVYYFTMRALCMVYRDKEDLQQLKEEYERAEKPPLDLSLTPIFMRTKEQTPVVPGNMTRVQPGNYSVPAFPMQVQPATTLTHRFNNAGPPHPLRPVYAGFEFLP